MGDTRLRKLFHHQRGREQVTKQLCGSLSCLRKRSGVLYGRLCVAIDVIVQQRLGVATAARVGFLFDDATNLFAVKPLSDFRVGQTTLHDPQFIHQAVVAQTGIPPSDVQHFL